MYYEVSNGEGWRVCAAAKQPSSHATVQLRLTLVCYCFLNTFVFGGNIFTCHADVAAAVATVVLRCAVMLRYVDVIT